MGRADSFESQLFCSILLPSHINASVFDFWKIHFTPFQFYQRPTFSPVKRNSKRIFTLWKNEKSENSIHCFRGNSNPERGTTKLFPQELNSAFQHQMARTISVSISALFPIIIVPPYLQGIQLKTLSGYLKPWIIPNSNRHSLEIIYAQCQATTIKWKSQ